MDLESPVLAIIIALPRYGHPLVVSSFHQPSLNGAIVVLSRFLWKTGIVALFFIFKLDMIPVLLPEISTWCWFWLNNFLSLIYVIIFIKTSLNLFYSLAMFEQESERLHRWVVRSTDHSLNYRDRDSYTQINPSRTNAHDDSKWKWKHSYYGSCLQVLYLSCCEKIYRLTFSKYFSWTIWFVWIVTQRYYNPCFIGLKTW